MPLTDTRPRTSKRYRCVGPERLAGRSKPLPPSSQVAPWIMRRVPLVKDEDALDGHRIWAVQNLSNRVSRIRLGDGIVSGSVENVIISDVSGPRVWGGGEGGSGASPTHHEKLRTKPRQPGSHRSAALAARSAQPPSCGTHARTELHRRCRWLVELLQSEHFRPAA